MKSGKMLALAAALALNAVADNFVWNAASDARWNVAGNWKDKATSAVATNVPAVGDRIWIVTDSPIELAVTNAQDLAVLNAVDAVHLNNRDARITLVSSPGADTAIMPPIYGGDNLTAGNPTVGRFEIKGGGTVRLTAKSVAQGYKVLYFTIDATTVYLPQNSDLALTGYSLGLTTVTNGAAVYMPVNHDGSKNSGGNYVTISALFGDGDIRSTENTEVRFTGIGAFSGTFDERIRIFMSGRQFLTGTNSPMNWTPPRVFNGLKNWTTGLSVLGVGKFGKAGENSSIGKGNNFQTNVKGGSYLYLGDGEETDKYFYGYANSEGYSVLDGGETGGLVLYGTGGFTTGGGTGAAANHVVFGISGSGPKPCVLRGIAKEPSDDYLISFIKKGAGTWRFADPKADGLALTSARALRGSFSVDEGVFQFDTLAPRNEYCSLGLSSVLKGTELGAWRAMADVDYAFTLGGTNSALTALAEGTLEYTGTNAAFAADRPIKLEADGRLRANAAKPIRYRLVAPTSPRAKTLTLDGSSPATNEVLDVLDTAEHPVSVVKEGTGTWQLGGSTPFHGDLTVKGGTLLVTEYPAGSTYTWFRYTLKNMFRPVTDTTSTNAFVISFIGFYDKDNKTQNLNLTTTVDEYEAGLGPGQVAYGTMRRHGRGPYYTKACNEQSPTNLCSAACACCAVFNNAKNNLNVPPQRDVPLSHIPVVFRLPQGSAEVASYDWRTGYGWTTGNRAGFQWTPSAWSLEGSVDGVHWENVNPDGGDYVITTNEYLCLQYDNRWVHGGGIDSIGKSHAGGWPIRGVSTNACLALGHYRSLSVASGARIVLPPTTPISNLKVDAAAGGGAISGGTLAADGTIAFSNATRALTSVAMDLSGVSGAANLANWTVTFDGTEKKSRKVSYANGILTVHRPGLVIQIR